MSKFKKGIIKEENVKTGILFIQCTRNNTIMTLTDPKGNTKAWASSGSIGFKNSRKSTAYAAEATAEKLALKTMDLGFNSVQVKMKGLGFGKRNSVRALWKAGLKITKIEELTPIPHNGCRSPKRRRK